MAGRGAVPAGLARKRATRAAPELRPGPLRGPARSWLTTVRSIPTWPAHLFGALPGRRTLTAKARPGRRKRRLGAPRGARVPQGTSHRFCVFRRAIPLMPRGIETRREMLCWAFSFAPPLRGSTIGQADRRGVKREAGDELRDESLCSTPSLALPYKGGGAICGSVAARSTHVWS